MYLQSTYNISPYSMQYYKITFLKYERLKDLDILKQRIACFRGPGHLLKFFFPFCVTVFDHFQNSEASLDSCKAGVAVYCANIYKTLFSDRVLILFRIDVYILILFG